MLSLLGSSQPAVIDELVSYGVLDLVDDETHQIEVPSVATLDLTGQLMAAGASPEVVQSAWALMQSRIADLADELVAFAHEIERAIEELYVDEEQNPTSPSSPPAIIDLDAPTIG